MNTEQKQLLFTSNGLVFPSDSEMLTNLELGESVVAQMQEQEGFLWYMMEKYPEGAEELADDLGEGLAPEKSILMTWWFENSQDSIMNQ